MFLNPDLRTFKELSRECQMELVDVLSKRRPSLLIQIYWGHGNWVNSDLSCLTSNVVYRVVEKEVKVRIYDDGEIGDLDGMAEPGIYMLKRIG